MTSKAIQPNINKADNKKLSAWFLGPKAENEQEFLELLTSALHYHSEWRRDYFPTDPPYIDENVKSSQVYKQQLAKVKQELDLLNERLKNSVPTFSSRYKGHMNWEVSMIGLLGYFTAMLYNQNNVATEASSVTTVIEQEVGDDLCKMLQFRSHIPDWPKAGIPTAWGHVTSCGSVANFEGAWAARNVKYLAYSVRLAIRDPKYSAGNDLTVILANKTQKLLRELEPENPDHLWILLNIPANNSLDLLHRFGDALAGEVGKGIDLALAAVRPFGPQTKGIGAMPGGTPHYLVPATAHYSWAKSGALLGVGENNMERISVDEFGRLNTDELETSLRDKVTRKIVVSFVVAILGSTTEGAMDPIKKVSELRDKLREELNFDFNIHADAAWGGYCCSMLDLPIAPTTHVQAAEPKVATVTTAALDAFVPVTNLSSYVREQLEAIHLADTITLDPHKAGYIQYPAGSICFQNKRMRDMLAYKAPYITPLPGTVEDPSVGTYGIDGSRAGAAAAATYLHHRVTGLNPQGHGMLVGQANFTAKQFWALLATMAGENDPFIISQLHQPTPEMIPLLKRALALSNDELVYKPDLVELLQQHGPDFLINNFAVNYAYPVLAAPEARTWNDSLQKSMDLMSAIGEQLNTPYAQVDPDTTRPRGVSRKGLFIIRDTLYSETYSAAITQLTKNVKLPYNDSIDKTYSMLVSTNMEPWSTAKGFLNIFHAELRQAILRAIGQLHNKPALHSFVLVDAAAAEVFGEHIASFTVPEQNYQTIVKIEFGIIDPQTGRVTGNESVKYQIFSEYRDKVVAQGYKPLILVNKNVETLNSLLYREDNDQWFEATFHIGDTQLEASALVRVSDIILHNHFDPAARYPANEKYIVFGAVDKVYASHLVTQAPNFQHLIQLKTSPPGVSDLLEELGVEVTLAGITTVVDRTKNPLQVGFTYSTELIRENAESYASTITVQSDIWFDTTLNGPTGSPTQHQGASAHH